MIRSIRFASSSSTSLGEQGVGTTSNVGIKKRTTSLIGYSSVSQVSTKLVLREGSLIKAIGDGRTRPEVVFVPVVSRDECMGLAHFNFRRHRQCDTTVE